MTDGTVEGDYISIANAMETNGSMFIEHIPDDIPEMMTYAHSGMFAVW